VGCAKTAIQRNEFFFHTNFNISIVFVNSVGDKTGSDGNKYSNYDVWTGINLEITGNAFSALTLLAERH